MTTPSNRPGQPARATQPDPAGSVTNFPADQSTSDSQVADVGGGTTSNVGFPATAGAAPKVPSLADPTLALAADVLDDAERTRIANQNRLRQLTRSVEDGDGVERGFGLDESHPDVARLAALVDMLVKVEHQAELNLARKMRAHPLGPWVKAQPGVGDKQAARLLAAVGDPAFKADGTQRRVSDLWSYCGHGDPSRRRRSGMTQADALALGNQTAKMRLHLIADKVQMQTGTNGRRRSPYRDVYERRREVTAVTHPDWTDGHSHNDALRILGKELLRDLWREARRLHGLPADQTMADTHVRAVGGATTSPGQDMSATHLDAAGGPTRPADQTNSDARQVRVGGLTPTHSERTVA